MRHGLVLAVVLSVLPIAATACGFDAPPGDETEDPAESTPLPDAPVGTVGGPSTACADPDIRLCFDFEEDQANGVAVDSSGYSHNATTFEVDTVDVDHGGPSQHGASVGDESYMYIEPAKTLAIEGAVTLSMWVQPHHDIASTLLVTDGHYRLQHVGGQAYACRIGGREVHSDNLVGVDQWTHVACTYDGEAVRLYVNGQFTACNRGTPSYSADDDGTALTADLDDEEHFSGQLDQVRVLARAQPQDEICAGAGLAGCVPRVCPP